MMWNVSLIKSMCENQIDFVAVADVGDAACYNIAFKYILAQLCHMHFYFFNIMKENVFRYSDIYFRFACN